MFQFSKKWDRGQAPPLCLRCCASKTHLQHIQPPTVEQFQWIVFHEFWGGYKERNTWLNWQRNFSRIFVGAQLNVFLWQHQTSGPAHRSMRGLGYIPHPSDWTPYIPSERKARSHPPSRLTCLRQGELWENPQNGQNRRNKKGIRAERKSEERKKKRKKEKENKIRKGKGKNKTKNLKTKGKVQQWFQNFFFLKKRSNNDFRIFWKLILKFLRPSSLSGIPLWIFL